LIIKGNSFVCITLAILLGYVTGEFLKLEHITDALTRMVKKAGGRFSAESPYSDEEYIKIFSKLIMLLFIGTTGIVGAITEGLTGQYDYLLIKSVIDFFLPSLSVPHWAFLWRLLPCRYLRQKRCCTNLHIFFRR